MSIKNNTKAHYLRMYPNMLIHEIELEITKFDKSSLEAGITLETSNRHKYLRGWLMRANLKINENKKEAENEQVFVRG